MHEENTKEINTETEFGYVMKHLHKIKPTFISIFCLNADLSEMLDQTLGRVFHQDICKHLEVVKKLGLRPRFSTHFSGFGYPDETLFLVFDLLRRKFTVVAQRVVTFSLHISSFCPGYSLFGKLTFL